MISSVPPVNYSTTMNLNYKINVVLTLISIHCYWYAVHFSCCSCCFCSDTTSYILGIQVHNAWMICSSSKWLMSFLPFVCPDDTEARPPHLATTMKNETANHIGHWLFHWHRSNTAPTRTSVQVMLSVQKVQTWEGETGWDAQTDQQFEVLYWSHLESYCYSNLKKKVRSTI